MSISKRERMLIVVVVLLALIGAYYLYYLKPCIDEIKTLNLDIDSKELQLSANEQQQSQLDELQAKVDGMDEQIALYGDSIAQAFDQPPVLVYLSNTVKACAQKGSINFEQPEQIGQIEHCAITITMISTYDGLKMVLDSFSEAPYLLRVTQLSAAIPAAGDTASTDTGSGTAAEGTAGTDSGTATEGTTGGDTGAVIVAPTQPSAPVPDVLSIRLVLDFYSLAGEIPEDATYAFDTDRQYGGDIFY